MKRLCSFKFLLVLSITFLMSVSTSWATTHIVTNLNDGPEPDNLRNSIGFATPGDVITFQEGLIGQITLVAGGIVIDRDITIQGPGAETIAITAFSPTTLVYVNPGVNADISGLSLLGGIDPGQSGGAIYNAGNLRLSGCVLSGNNTSNNVSGLGGAICNETISSVASMDIFDCLFLGNLSDSGGAIYNDGDLSVKSCDFTGNNALNGNGGAIMNHGVAELTGCNLSFNTMTSTYAISGGGAIANYNTLVLDSCVLESNQALDDRRGGGIYSYNATGGTFLTNCTLKVNSAGSGGAIRNQDRENYHSGGISLSLTNCLLAENQAYKDAGGAISSNADYNDVILNDCVIRDNSSVTYGGGIYYGNDNLKMRNCTVSENISQGGGSYPQNTGGGGIYIGSSGIVELWNCTIAGNIASSDVGFGGGGILNLDGNLKTSNCTITGNYSRKGGGLSFRNQYVLLQNTIVAFNDGVVSRDIYVDPSGSIECDRTGSSCNLVGEDPENLGDETGTWFDGYTSNIILSDDIASTDVFGGVEEGPEVGAPGNSEKMQVFALRADSLAVDSANKLDFHGDLISEDQRGVSRPQGDGWDIGAYERELVSYTITTTTSGGGIISPESADVPEGADQAFTITPYDGFVIEELSPDGQRFTGFTAQGDTYTFHNVSSDHQLTARFMVDPAMMEEAGVEDFGISETTKGPLSQPVAISYDDIVSIAMEKEDGSLLEGSLLDDKFVTGLSFEMEFDSPDMGIAVTQVDVVMEISRDLLGSETCAAIDGGEDLEEAFFENVSLYKIVSSEVYDLFEVASADQDPYEFFEIYSEDEGYAISMMMVIADEAVPQGEASVQALLDGQESFFFVYDGAKDGKFNDPIVAVRNSDDVAETPITSGGGSCNVGIFPAAFGFLMVPLLFLLRR